MENKQFIFLDEKSGTKYNAERTNIFNAKDEARYNIITEKGDSFYVFAYSNMSMILEVSKEIEGWN